MIRQPTWTSTILGREPAKISTIQLGINREQMSNSKDRPFNESVYPLSIQRQKRHSRGSIQRSHELSYMVENHPVINQNNSRKLSWKAPDLSQRRLHLQTGPVLPTNSPRKSDQLPPLRFSTENRLFADVHSSWTSRNADLEATYRRPLNPAITSTQFQRSYSNVHSVFSNTSQQKSKLGVLRPTLDSVLSSKPIQTSDFYHYSYNHFS